MRNNRLFRNIMVSECHCHRAAESRKDPHKSVAGWVRNVLKRYVGVISFHGRRN